MSQDDLRLGVIGISKGNGHPYSFASIVNGYSADGFAESEWEVILDYLEERDPAEFGFCNVEVSHAWTQDPEETEKLRAAAKIPHTVDNPERLIDLELDGILLLRDDYETHLDFARPFLDADTPVFIDKPLTMDVEELAAFEPALRSGQLMSCSGLRYARELDDARSDLAAYGDLRAVRGSVVFDWTHYGIHVLEAILSVVDAQPTAVFSTPSDHESLTIETDAAYSIQIDALGDAPVVFDIDIYGSEKTTRHELTDNFQAFRRTLYHFIQSIRTKSPAIPPEETLTVIRTLIAGRRAHVSDEVIKISTVDL
ncbi:MULTISPECIES: Gfo/Idh/MocA family protein [Salinibaculum]|uniref:Gfo/Idh/MocA family protein n=1 Tax=Salinibaculum TaxID=2732368 RepID=UPI0030CABE0B